ncbi:MAG TPA: hypothetical protein VK155_00435 [Bacteroidales bacterium]|jgi:hypothetical protein|nr:hypothetical protein [Bacteroidales bacterium]
MSAGEIMKVIEFLEDNRSYLNPVQVEYLRSLRKYLTWKGSLSKEHVRIMLKLKKRMPSRI